MMWLRYVLFVVFYAIWAIGYACQTSVTRAAQSVLTNDPKQRPLFTVFNTVGSCWAWELSSSLAPSWQGMGCLVTITRPGLP